ncbi:MAG: NAD(P)/FAD-dependent oxidoreductase, partial [Bacteroidota bacterium]
IRTAYWLRQKCPDKKIAILEARTDIGGTWSLFRYPGVRSDSDMFTFGYRFKPWANPQSLSSGENILDYLKETVKENKLSDYILFEHKMTRANWSDAAKCWTLTVETPEGQHEMTCRFLSICTGYYDYQEAHRPQFEGEEQFQGDVIIPQFWPKNFDYRDKRVVVVGSGATAITLVPSMADQGAAHVTMLQRSPTYVMNLPNRNQIFSWTRKFLPLRGAYRLTRWQNILLQMISFGFAKLFPKLTKAYILKEIARELPKDYPVSEHFSPRYNPWDQRLCVVPDGDLFRAIREEKASVVTDTIACFTERGITLNSGMTLEADAIVLATGLKIQLLGGADLRINGKPTTINQSMVYKGMMMSGLPNFIYAFGYTNASWTLKVDLTANYLCKLINHMDKKGYSVVVAEEQGQETEEDFLNLSSGYIKRAKSVLPRQGAERPWRNYQNYLVDMLATRWGSVQNRVLKFEA